MDKLIKKLETIVKYTKDTRINVDVTDLQRLIQEIKNQEKIINEMADDLQTPVNSPEWIIKYYRERVK